MVAEGRGEERMGLLFNGYRISVWEDDRVVEMEECGACTTW